MSLPPFSPITAVGPPILSQYDGYQGYTAPTRYPQGRGASFSDDGDPHELRTKVSEQNRSWQSRRQTRAHGRTADGHGDLLRVHQGLQATRSVKIRRELETLGQTYDDMTMMVRPTGDMKKPDHRKPTQHKNQQSRRRLSAQSGHRKDYEPVEYHATCQKCHRNGDDGCWRLHPELKKKRKEDNPSPKSGDSGRRGTSASTSSASGLHTDKGGVNAVVVQLHSVDEIRQSQHLDREKHWHEGF